MSLRNMWLLLLVVGTLGFESKPELVAEEAGQSLRRPELGRDAGVAEIKKLGGSYRCDEESPGRPVVGVNLDFTLITDAGLEHLKGLTSLQWLYLDGTQVTDVGLKHLRRMTSLHKLYLRGTNVTDAGVNELRKALPNIWVNDVWVGR